METIQIDVLHLSARSMNVLRTAGLRTIGDIQAKSDDFLHGLPNCGWKSVYEIRFEIGRMMNARIEPPLTEERVREIIAEEMAKVGA